MSSSDSTSLTRFSVSPLASMTRRLADTASGRATPDLVLTGARLLSTYSDRILENLESIYRESYERASAEGAANRMTELESAYMRDQLMLEILLDIRDLFSVAPGSTKAGASTIETLERIRRLAGGR